MAKHYSPRHYYTPRSIRRSESRSKRKIIFTFVVAIIIIFFAFTKGIPWFIGSLSLFRASPTTSPAPKLNATLAPPTLIIPYDATNSGVISISGYSVPDSSIELYIDKQLVDATPTDQTGNFRFPAVVLNLGLNNISGITVSSDNTKSLTSKAIVLDYNSDKPRLDIFEPSDNLTKSGEDKKVKISGQTNGSDIQVSINSAPIYVNSEGKFETTKDLNPGENQIIIIATNNYGSTTQVMRKVTLNP